MGATGHGGAGIRCAASPMRPTIIEAIEDGASHRQDSVVGQRRILTVCACVFSGPSRPCRPPRGVDQDGQPDGEARGRGREREREGEGEGEGKEERKRERERR